MLIRWFGLRGGTVLLALLAGGCGARNSNTHSENGAASPPKVTSTQEKSGPVYQSGTWCSSGEAVIFSCVFEDRATIASLCGEYSAASDTLETMVFRHGAGEPAVDVSNQPGDSEVSDVFDFGHHTRAQVSMTRVRLRDQDGASWTISSDYYGEDNPAAEVDYRVEFQSAAEDQGFYCLPGTVQDRLMEAGETIGPDKWMDI